VLVVDDHPVNRLVARGYLGRLGCTVTEAETGQAALQAARAGQFDVILLDLGLPDIAGEEVAARIDRKGAQLAILTADLQRDDADTRHRLGADRILTKPISPRELAAFLSEGGTGAKAPPPGPAVDAALAEDIDSLGAGQTAAILRALLDDMTAAVPQLRAETDPVARRKLAHRLKGAAANFRLDGFCALMQRIQAGDLSALDSLDQVAAGAARDLVAAAQRAGLPFQPGNGAEVGAGAAKQ
jgi:two-component system sensor histidine kinase TorS